MYNLITNLDKYIDEIIYLDNQFFEQEYMWTDEYQRKVYERNKDSFIAVTYDDELIGYLNYLNITDDKYNRIKKSNRII